jgi:membrane-bound metal-dependent hydrolase YbcI (DUF457 family)
MADFKTHITTSCVLGGGYAALGAYYGLPIEAALVAGGLCGVGGMLPDIDSDSGVPLRETMGLAAALTPMLLVDRFQQLGLNYEQMVLAAAASYLFVRFGIARLMMKYTVHRGMFHSIPALLIFTGLAFLFFCGSTNLQLRYFKAGGVFVGVLSHLLLDEIFAVEWIGGRWRFKKSFGTAFKLWGENAWGNLSTYAKLALVALMILSEPAIMERYGNLSPIVIDNERLRERLHLPFGGADGMAPAQGIAGGSQMPAAWAAAHQAYGTAPTAGEAPPSAQPDRNIYDTARRIWQRLAH